VTQVRFPGETCLSRDALVEDMEMTLVKSLHSMYKSLAELAA
jgi:hypothetical protein